MARRAAQKAKKPSITVTAIPRRARRLCSISDSDEKVESDLDGALVRLYPGQRDEVETRKLVEAIVSLGAAAVKVMPPDRKLDALPATRATQVYSGPRQAVEKLVAEAVGVDRAALGALCDEIMSEEGL